jgi:hypothetical protein
MKEVEPKEGLIKYPMYKTGGITGILCADECPGLSHNPHTGYYCTEYAKILNDYEYDGLEHAYPCDECIHPEASKETPKPEPIKICPECKGHTFKTIYDGSIICVNCKRIFGGAGSHRNRETVPGRKG